MTYAVDLTPAARADIVDALGWSLENFGAAVRDGYEGLIFATLSVISVDPRFPGSHDRSDLADGFRMLHLRACRDEVSPAVRRISHPRHFVVYRQVADAIEVARLLHDAMDIQAWRITK
ncbi:type II toxin-antitoxin system RelE/ParE family toxin [Gulosibacter sediminis]|uniref:type II toxin-antitoxin system RelE/ParE family toxin n=1 Tax=Gulosibacter sediminis TaxID=1729695 RepID=UPI0024AE78B1|nr:type II toxin-antitoxin system RelE/ParE family toxin [Gulosibacter sediminis]